MVLDILGTVGMIAEMTDELVASRLHAAYGASVVRAWQPREGLPGLRGTDSRDSADSKNEGKG